MKTSDLIGLMDFRILDLERAFNLGVGGFERLDEADQCRLIAYHEALTSGGDVGGLPAEALTINPLTGIQVMRLLSRGKGAPKGHGDGRRGGNIPLEMFSPEARGRM